MAGDGEVKGVYYPPDEDFQIFTTKKAITGLLAGKYVSTEDHLSCLLEYFSLSPYLIVSICAWQV